MKFFEEKVTTPTKYKKLVEIKCDLCGILTKNKWKTGDFDATDSLVYLKTGGLYPEGGCGEIITIDICPNCFTSKLVPWAVSFGGKPNIEEWDQ